MAIREARLRGTTVRAIHVWHVPVGEYLGGSPPDEEETLAYEEKAQRLLADAVLRAAGDDPVVPVEQVLKEAPAAAPALVEEAETADLLVVGSRGLSGIRELVLGSVSHECCRHAHCPVIVVPPSKRLHAQTDERSVATTGSGPAA